MIKALPLVVFLFLGLIFGVELRKYLISQKQADLRINFYNKIAICKTISGFTRQQLELCYRYPEEMAEALKGFRQAIQECHYQFINSRWNCSSLSLKSKNPYNSGIFLRGFKETAFAYAISSAGIAISIAKRWSQGLIVNSGSDNHKYKKKDAWKWVGCYHNFYYGIKFSKMFFESKETSDDIHSQISLHNANVGRMEVLANMQRKCKCHGLSGSCELKTCWKIFPDLHFIGKILKNKFESAILVYLSNYHAQKNFENNNINHYRNIKRWIPHKKQQRRILKNNLLYYEKSPSFCEADHSLASWGTYGRTCSLNTTEQNSCSFLCCGRGYSLIKQRLVRPCSCTFRWCCTIQCQKCFEEKWINICK